MPICFVVTDDVVYSAVDDKPKRHRHLQRISNITATGTASLLVDEYDEDWSRLWWVRLDGQARLVDNTAETERAIRSLSDKYPQYREQPPSGPVLARRRRTLGGLVGDDVSSGSSQRKFGMTSSASSRSCSSTVATPSTV